MLLLRSCLCRLQLLAMPRCCAHGAAGAATAAQVHDGAIKRWSEERDDLANADKRAQEHAGALSAESEEGRGRERSLEVWTVPPQDEPHMSAYRAFHAGKDGQCRSKEQGPDAGMPQRSNHTDGMTTCTVPRCSSC